MIPSATIASTDSTPNAEPTPPQQVVVPTASAPLEMDWIESTKRLPVIEIFGPTVQGEGPQIGVRTLFLRLGYCDYRCVWCDSKIAVTPSLVRKHATWMNSHDIVDTLTTLGDVNNTNWVTISGGNPAIHDLTDIVNGLHKGDMRIALETQGTIWQDWITAVDQLIISPKPPSSMMTTDYGKLEDLLLMVTEGAGPGSHLQYALKVVVFDEDDFAYAKGIHQRFPYAPFYLSVGNDTLSEDVSPELHLKSLVDKLRWLTELTLLNIDMSDVIVLPQLHVLMWGNKKGV